MGSIHPSVAVAHSTETPYFTPANNGGQVEVLDANTPTLFRPLRIRDLTLKNRMVVSPMCMYSAEPNPSSPSIGALTDYHLAHLGQLALKGAGLVFTEALAVQPNGRISPNDAGLWQGEDSEQFRGLQRVVRFAHSQGAKVAVQISHAGRKASVSAPWLTAHIPGHTLKSDESVHGWPGNVVAPSGGEKFTWDGNAGGYWVPKELSVSEIEEIVRAFAHSAEMAVKAGVDVLEIHAAHGYLLNQFLSPVSNQRTDGYGGSFEGRVRIVKEVAAAVRAVIPPGTPLFLRISATEWLQEEGIVSWDMESSLALAKLLPEMGVDLLDVSSGGNSKDQKIKISTNFQIDMAGRLRRAIREAGAETLVGSVGFITEAEQARDIVQGADEEARENEGILTGSEPKADVVLLARQFLREPEWVFKAAKQLGVKVSAPMQFLRAGLN